MRAEYLRTFSDPETQLALLHARLTFAASRGVDLAVVVTLPGTASQRNAERQGFRPAYTRGKWQRSPAPTT